MQVLSIGKKKRVHAIAFSPSGEELATVSGDGVIRVWNLATGTARLSAPVEDTQSGFAIAYLDRTRLVFAGSYLSWWDTAVDQWQPITRGFSWGPQLVVSPGGEWLVAVDQTRSMDWSGEGLIVRSTSDWARQPQMPEPEHTTGGAAFSADGKFLATAHMAVVGERTRRVGASNAFAGYSFEENEYDYLVRVREMPSGRVLQTLSGWQQAVTHLAFSPDGATLAGTAGPRLRVWDVATGREVAVHKRGTKHFQGLSFARDGSFLATVSNDETVRIWNARTWDEHTTYKWDVGKLLNIAFAPDGLRAATGSDKGQVVIWDVE